MCSRPVLIHSSPQECTAQMGNKFDLKWSPTYTAPKRQPEEESTLTASLRESPQIIFLRVITSTKQFKIDAEENKAMSENKYKQLRAETDLDRLLYGHIKFTYVYPMKKGDSKFANMCREVKSVKKDLTDLEAKQNL